MLLVVVQSTLTTVYLYGITVLVYYIVYYGICNYGITALCNMAMEESQASSSAEETWNNIKDTTYKAATEVLGYTTHKHKDWFDEQDLAARVLLDAMYSTHLALSLIHI